MVTIRNVTTPENIESRGVACRAVAAIKAYTGNNAFTKELALSFLMRHVSIKTPSYDYKHKYINQKISRESAERLFNYMMMKEYIVYSHFQKRDKLHPNAPVNGVKMFRFGNLRMTECSETTWYKNRERKERYVHKESKLEIRRCRALQQIYTMFGQMSFTYKTVTYTANMITKMAKDKELNLTKAEKIAIDHMKTKLYNYDSESFLEVWQSLIKNGYITPHMVKTPDGYIKRTGMFKINHAYLKRCLPQLI